MTDQGLIMPAPLRSANRHSCWALLPAALFMTFLVLTLRAGLIQAQDRDTRWQVAEIYLATMGYAPEAEGLDYWVKNIQTRPEWNPTAVAQSFFDQPLVQEQYPAGQDADTLIQALYQNIFNRPADAEGFAYWRAELAAGRVRRNQMVIALINGGWNNPESTADMARFGNRVKVALAFADYQTEHGIVYSQLSEADRVYLRQAGRSVIEDVGSDSLDVFLSQLLIEGLLERLVESGGDTVQDLRIATTASGASAVVDGISEGQDSARYFKVAVPEGVMNLVIRTEGEAGNPNLYVERTAKPTLAPSADASYCASTGTGTAEQCAYATPEAGDYYILLYGASAYFNVTLTVSWDKESEQGDSYSVTTYVSPGGSISPSSKTVTHGSTADFTVTPQSGYSIVSVVGCNGNLSGNLYVTGMITALCTVTATFSQNIVEGQEEGVMQGYFRDAPVGGLEYSSCNWDGAKCLTGFTDANGMYFYRDGDTIKFEVGNLFLLETKAVPLLTPENATSNDFDANRLARFLQGLDDDSDLTNGINISEKTRELAANTTVTRILEIDDQQFERFTAAFPIAMPSAEVANKHLSATNYLAAMDSIDNKYAKWILNRVSIDPSIFNRNILSNSAAARLKYAIWQDISSTLLI
jgi:hypothetical protein